MHDISDKSVSSPLSAGAHRAGARACANIALAKYWGKLDAALNLPETPSLSLTLEPLATETWVEFTENIPQDVLELDGRVATEAEVKRVRELLNRVRESSGLKLPARVQSHNSFPTAAGLASSASGFAALATAASRAAGLQLNEMQLSALARRSSASAARSIYGGFVELPAAQAGEAELSARQLARPEHWELSFVIAVIDDSSKAIGSTEAMELSKRTSPYYTAWVQTAGRLFSEVRQGVLEKNLSRVGVAMEQSALAMHGCAMASRPGVLYWRSATVNALQQIAELRRQGIEVWATIDAGPQVKALCRAADAAIVEAELSRMMGVIHTITARPGPGVKAL